MGRCKKNHYMYATGAALLFLTLLTLLTLTFFEGVSLTPFTLALLCIIVVLVPAKLSNIIERWGLPGVLGEIAVGVLLGNLSLIGIHIFEIIPHNHVIEFLAELGVLILLFQVGLDSNLNEVGKVGGRAFAVALSGIAFTFIGGAFFVAPLLLPELSRAAHLFIGATLTTTSVGITARVLKDLGALRTKEAKLIIWSAVIDDIFGLVILATVSALFTVGTLSVGSVLWVLLKALLFLSSAVVCGSLLTLEINLLFSHISHKCGMRFTLAMLVAISFAFLAYLLGLAPIIGAFAAGLVLKSVYFKHFNDNETIESIKKHFHLAPAPIKTQLNKDLKRHEEKHVEELVAPLGEFLTPIFFVLTGFAVDLSLLTDISTIVLALAFTGVAIVGKLLPGIFTKKEKGWIVGWGMVPRGEVVLIFATTGLTLGALTQQVFTALLIMMVLTALIAPPVLSHLIRRNKKKV